MDDWERALLGRELGAPDDLVPPVSLAPLFGQHGGLGALRVGAAALDAARGTSAVLVHGIARGGCRTALVVEPAADPVSEHLIVIPVFNEAATIGDIVERGAAARPGAGGGRRLDRRSAAVAAAAGAEVVSLGRRRGKGAALRRGFAEGARRGVERLVTLDGDGQHDPDDIPRAAQGGGRGARRPRHRRAPGPARGRAGEGDARRRGSRRCAWRASSSTG